jgi:hypothetical protein
MSGASSVLWSNWKLLAVLLAINLAAVVVIEGVLNRVLHLAVPTEMIAVVPLASMIVAFPRWRSSRRGPDA